MPDEPNLGNVPQATVVPRSRARISVVWIITILAAVVALGIAVQRILSEGPTVKIVFKAAQGVEANKTFVKYKDVNIGQVTAVQLTPDYTHVEVTAKIQKSAAGLMVEDARFFVVEPRVTLSGVSGLGTLLSGNYIGFEVGKSKKKETKFVGLETPPVITGDQPGKEFKLTANSIGSLGIGSPVYYRRLQAGQVTAMHDPTEGGLATALWELAEASGRALTIDRRAVPIPPLAARVCQAFGLDPLNAIASGALLFTATASDAPRIRYAIEAAGITCAEIGEVADGPAAVWHTGATGREPLPCPVRDAIAQIYEV